MSSPFSLDNASLNSNASSLKSPPNNDPESSSDSDPESDGDSRNDGPDLSPQQSFCLTGDGHDVASSQAISSTEWMFSGSYIVDMRSNPAQFSVEFVRGLIEELARKPTVFIYHMVIFVDSNINQTHWMHSVSLRGYIHGKKTTMSVWKEWIGQKELVWIPLSRIGTSDEYNEDLMRSQDPESTWHLLGKYGKRKRFQVICTAFCFEATLDIDVPERSGSHDDEASDILEIVQAKFNDTLSMDEKDEISFQSKGATFVLVQCDSVDIQQLADASPGSTRSVSIQGFIQSKLTDLQTWRDWFDALWSTARGGLCGHPDFENATSESSTWVPIYTFGMLKKNNHGRCAAHKQASGV